MYSVRVFILALFCFALSAAHVSIKNENGGQSEFNVKSLPAKDRLMLLLTSKVNPKSFQKLPQETFAEISGYEPVPSIDNFFIDARQMFTQAKKLSEDANLPEFNWGYRYAFCIWFFCIDTEIRYDTNDSKFIGAENIASNTEVSPTTIQNTFQIPFFNWTSPGFLITSTDYIRGTINYAGNSFVSFANVTVAFSCDYHFVENVGIQLDNFTIYFDAGNVRGWLLDIYEMDFEGNLIARYEPEEYPYDEDMMSYWGYIKRKYTSGLQYSLNCFLSNGRSDSECRTEQDDDDESRYYRLINLQFIQSLGLGALIK